MKRKRLDAMAAFAQLLVLIAIFLLASYANAFLNPNQVAGNQIRLNHLIRFKETNKQNSEANLDLIINLNGQTTNQILEWDAELLNILSTKQKPELLSSQPVQIDEEIIRRSPNATNASLQTSFVFYPVFKCHQPMKLHISPGAILYYLPIWWIVMYGSLLSGKSSITSSRVKLCFLIGSACPMSQITQDKLRLPIGHTCQGLNKHESSCASQLVGCAKCLNSHKSSCASKVARAKCHNSHESSCAPYW
jgi:hypothetical protein